MPVPRLLSSLALSSALLFAGGCMQALEEQGKKTGSIMKKTTQDIGKYDPETMTAVQDGEEQITNPITGALEAYGPAVAQLSQLSIIPMITQFELEHNHYPNYDEFMEMVKTNNIQLPVLPGKKRYMYDEKEHALIVVHPPSKDAAEKPAEGAAPKAP